MRCIEIEAERLLDNPLARLTLTWDVLKSFNWLEYIVNCARLTLTWDVLKCMKISCF